MSKSAASGLGLGDQLYSLPVIHKLGVTTLYLKQMWFGDGYLDNVSSLKDLMALQGIEIIPTSNDYPRFQYDPALTFDYDMDICQNRMMRGREPHIQSYLLSFGFSTKGWNIPWLKIDDVPTEYTGKDFNLFYLTPRWRERSLVDWRRVYKQVQGSKFFIGTYEDCKIFRSLVEDTVEYLPTKDMLAMARLIRDCKALYCNQGVALVIAQGIGKNYWCDFKRGKTNCNFYTPNEHVL